MAYDYLNAQKIPDSGKFSGSAEKAAARFSVCRLRLGAVGSEMKQIALMV